MTEVAVHWEYKELDIPLEIANVQGEKQFDRANNRATAIILKYLQDASRDGWQADELTDFFSLLQRSRVKARRHQ